MGKWFWLLFVVLILYNMIFDLIKLLKSKDVLHGKTKENYKEKSNDNTIADKIIIIVVSLALLAGLIFLLFNKSISGIIVIIIGVPTVLNHLVKSIKAADSLKYIVLGGNNYRELSISEKLKFDIFVTGLLVFSQFIPATKFIFFVKENLMSYLVIEIILSLFILLSSFLITFIVIVELITPLRHLRKGYEFLALRIRGKCKSLSLYFWRTWDTPLLCARFTNRLLIGSKSKKIIIRLISLVFLIFAFSLDFVCNLIYLAYSFIVCFCFGVIIDFLRILGKGLLRLLKRITGIPEYMVVKNTFRMSGIIAIFVLVIVNRMKLVFIPDNSFLGITEFLASAIIIPIIFEWIYSSPISEKKAL